ncbi:MAG: phosphodiester glycosidase family protein [Actinobacteria bacterium]|nr:phosphodiester glycosidase family protein [Actinomycetota bacterium]
MSIRTDAPTRTQNELNEEPAELEATGGYFANSEDVEAIRRRDRSADRLVGAASGVIVVAVLMASAVLAHAETAVARMGWVAAWAAMITVALGIESRLGRPDRPLSSRRPTRPAARRRRLAFLLSVLAAAVVAVGVLLTLGWTATSLLTGISSGGALAVSRHRRESLRPRRTRGWVLVAIAIATLPVIFSLDLRLTDDGADPLTIRTVEWLRDNGGASMVDAAENWWYARHPPPVGGVPATLPQAPSTVAPDPTTTSTVVQPGTPSATPPPAPPPTEPKVVLAPVPTPAQPVLPGEGQWSITAGTDARPAVATTFVRPDAIHTSVVVGIMRIDPMLVRLRLIPGTEQPGGPAPSGGAVPLEDRPTLVAAFNSGFKMKDARGGWYSEGNLAVPLRDGAATLVLRDDGRADVGVWGRDDTLDPHITALRQNLVLVVDNGQLVAGTDDASSGKWGGTVGNKILVNRSGVGITADGALVYAGGEGLSVATLGQTLIAAGAVRAMELDINYAWVNAFTYAPGPNGPVGTKLIAAMPYGPERYLRSQGRDFVSVTLNPPRP